MRAIASQRSSRQGLAWTAADDLEPAAVLEPAPAIGLAGVKVLQEARSQASGIGLEAHLEVRIDERDGEAAHIAVAQTVAGKLGTRLGAEAHHGLAADREIAEPHRPSALAHGDREPVLAGFDFQAAPDAERGSCPRAPRPVPGHVAGGLRLGLLTVSTTLA